MNYQRGKRKKPIPGCFIVKFQDVKHKEKMLKLPEYSKQASKGDKKK